MDGQVHPPSKGGGSGGAPPCAHHVHIMGPPCSHKSELVTSAGIVTKDSSKCSLRSMDSESDSIAYNYDCDIL